MTKVRKGMPDASCPDEQPEGSLPIVSAQNAYGGRGAALTAVLVDGERAWFEEAALHGRTAVEQSVRWVKSPAEVPAGRRYFPVWVYIRPAAGGGFQYYGLVAAEMVIDPEAGVGFKSLGDHVNRLDRAMKGQIDLSLLDEPAKTALLGALRQYPAVLASSPDALKEALGLKAEAST